MNHTVHTSGGSTGSPPRVKPRGGILVTDALKGVRSAGSIGTEVLTQHKRRPASGMNHTVHTSGGILVTDALKGIRTKVLTQHKPPPQQGFYITYSPFPFSQNRRQSLNKSKHRRAKPNINIMEPDTGDCPTP